MYVSDGQGFVDFVDLCAHYLHLDAVPCVKHIKINRTRVVLYDKSGQALDQYLHIKNLFPKTDIELLGE